MSLREQTAWRAIISQIRAYYIHNVFHTHKNEFGKGNASDGVMILVKALDCGVDISKIIQEVHDSNHGVAFVNHVETAIALEKMQDVLGSNYDF